MSAPWSSMWVAHEWRSTCGREPSPSPTRSPYLRTIPQAPWRVRRPPRWLRNTASASPRRAHRSGSMRAAARRRRARPPSASRASGRSARPAPCSPLPNARSSAPSRSTSASDRPTSSEIRSAGAVEHLEDRPVPHGRRRRRRRPSSSRSTSSSVERLRQPAGTRRHLDVGRRVGVGAGPRRPGSGAAPAPPPAPAPPMPAPGPRRAGRRRRRSTSASSTSASVEARAAQPGASSAAGRAGRRRACWPTGPARPPAT